jgi:hypothetical protein
VEGGEDHDLRGVLASRQQVRRIGFLDGYGVYASVALLALGFALRAAGSRMPR